MLARSPIRLSVLAALAAVPLAIAAGLPVLAQAPAAGGDKVVATVNGRSVMESELALADAEIGSDLGTLPEATRRRVLIEYLIETQLLAEAAEKAALGQGASFDQRLQYWRRKALRDSYFDNKIKSLVTETDAKRSFEAQVGQGGAAGVEIRARHILVDSEEKAKEVFELIAHGADFAAMARQHSRDPGSRENGGSLGYFTRGQMVPQFEEAAFKLGRGEVSQPVKTQFGWHLIRVDDRRERQRPDFDSVKRRIMAALIHEKAQDVVDQLRAKAKVDYVDPQVKAQIEAEKAGGPARR